MVAKPQDPELKPQDPEPPALASNANGNAKLASPNHSHRNCWTEHTSPP